MGVDQSVLLLKTGNDLDPKSIKSDLNSYDTRTPYIRGWGDYPGKESGLVTLTNANYPYNEGKCRSGDSGVAWIALTIREAEMWNNLFQK